MSRSRLRFFLPLFALPVLFLVLAALLPARGQQALTVQPSATGSAITMSSPSHLCWAPAGATLQNRLVVLLPDYSQSPSGYTAFLTNAATQGFHVLGLGYPNSADIAGGLCGATMDTSCHRRHRMQLCNGTPGQTTLTVDADNAIANRILAAVKYLAIAYPDNGWEAYLTQTGGMRWQNVIVAGHGDGAGNAAMMGMLYSLNRVVMMGWMDGVLPESLPPPWVQPGCKTESRDFFGFAHQLDERFDIRNVETGWTSLQMNCMGGMLLADTASGSFHNRRMLRTKLPYPLTLRDPTYTSMLARDYDTPKDRDDNNVYAPIWNHLLGAVPVEPTIALSLPDTLFCTGQSFQVPFLISNESGGGDASYLLRLDISTTGGCFDTRGTDTEVHATSGTLAADAAQLPPGTYRLRITGTTPCWVTPSYAFTLIAPPQSGRMYTSADYLLPGGSVTLTLQGHTGSVQWQYSLNGADFANIDGATEAVAQSPTLLAEGYTWFRAQVGGAGCQPVFSDTARVTVGSVTSASSALAAAPGLQLYPNPVVPGGNLHLTGLPAPVAAASLYTTTGQEYTLAVQAAAFPDRLSLPVPESAVSGTCILQLQLDNGQVLHRRVQLTR